MSDQPSGGIGLTGATFVVFLILKLCHVIDWSWWWITAPLWAPSILWAAIYAFVCFMAEREKNKYKR